MIDQACEVRLIKKNWIEMGPKGEPCCKNRCWSSGLPQKVTHHRWEDAQTFTECFVLNLWNHSWIMLCIKLSIKWFTIFWNLENFSNFVIFWILQFSVIFYSFWSLHIVHDRDINWKTFEQKYLSDNNHINMKNLFSLSIFYQTTVLKIIFYFFIFLFICPNLHFLHNVEWEFLGFVMFVDWINANKLNILN